MVWQLTTHSTAWSMCTLTFPSPWGEIPMHGEGCTAPRLSLQAAFCCIKGEHHGPRCNIHSQHTSINAEPLPTFYVVAPKSRAI